MGIPATTSSRLAEAFAYAEEIHRGQTRKKTRSPALSHLMAVASLVLDKRKLTLDVEQLIFGQLATLLRFPDYPVTLALPGHPRTGGNDEKGDLSLRRVSRWPKLEPSTFF